MSEAELRIKLGAEIYSSNNNNNNEDGNEDKSTSKPWTKLSSISPTSPTLGSDVSQFTSTIKPFQSSPLEITDAQPVHHSPALIPKCPTKGYSPTQKSPTSTGNKKIRLPLPAPGKSGKNRKQSSIPVGIAVARRRSVNTTSVESLTASSVPTVSAMSSQLPIPGVGIANSKSKRTSPNRPPQVLETSVSPVRNKSDRSKKAPMILNKSNSNIAGMSESVSPMCHSGRPESRASSGTMSVGAESGRGNVTIIEPSSLSASIHQPAHSLFADMRRTGNGIAGNAGHEFPGYIGFGQSPHFGNWSSQLNVPPGYNAVAAAYLQQQQQQLSMHPELPLQLSQSYGYNLSPYLYSGHTAESILQYEQFLRQQHQQKRDEQLRQQLQAQAYDISRVSACRSVTPIPNLSPRINIPSPSPTSHPNLYSGTPHWQSDLYQHQHYFTSSTATLSPRSLTSSTPSPVTVHDSHSYYMARKCITPNPVGVGPGSKHFPFNSPFSPSLLPARDVWKDVKIAPISNPRKNSGSQDKNESEQSQSETELEVERSAICKTPSSPRHDFRRMESLIEKRAEKSVPTLLHLPMPIGVELESVSNGGRSQSPVSEVKDTEAATVGAGKGCDGKKLGVPDLNQLLKSTSKPAALEVADQSKKKSKKRQLNPHRTKNETKSGPTEKYFIPVKREFYDSRIDPCNYSTKSPLSTSALNPVSRRREIAASAPSSSDNPTEKSMAVIDISRIKREVAESIYVDGSQSVSRTSAAGDGPPLWRSRRPETEGCSDIVNTSSKITQMSQNIDYFGKTSSDGLPSPRNAEPGNNTRDEQYNHNIRVTVNLPPPELGSPDGNFSPNASSVSDCEMPSFPKIVISSAESHLNLLATVAQEIGPYISMNTNRSPRRYESLIQIEPVEISERRPSAAGSCGSTSTSTISRISIDESTNFSPTTNLPPAAPFSDQESVPVQTIFNTPQNSKLSTEIKPTTKLYQLKIPQITPRIHTKPVKKERKKLEKPKKAIANVGGERSRERVRPILSTNRNKKPKTKGTSATGGSISKMGSGKSVIKKKTIAPSSSVLEVKQNSSGSHPCIYDFDFEETKPKLEPLYNRLDKPRHTQEQKHFVKSENPIPVASLEGKASSHISNYDDLKSKPLISYSKTRVKAAKDSSKQARNKVNHPPVIKMPNAPETKTSKVAKAEIIKTESWPKTSILAPLNPTMQIQSILNTMTSQQGQDSSSSDSSMWITDPAHAVKAIKSVTHASKSPRLPRRASLESSSLEKRRKAKVKYFKKSDNSQSEEDESKSKIGQTDSPSNTQKSQLKSFAKFSKKKNGQHHIKPCLKAEPEFREEMPSSDESELDALELDLKPNVVSEVSKASPPKPVKIRKPSIDMNIFSRRIRMSEDGGKDKNKNNEGADEKGKELEWNENVVIAGVDEMLDEMRILTEIQGLFYTGKLNALQPPDVYGVTLDNERGAPPHLIYSAEEVLEKCIREAKPWKASQLPHGLRICAYWSPQYSGLYPGKVSTDYDTITDLVPVEFDDGDTGVIKIGEIRLLAHNHPIREYDPNPLLTLEKKQRKRRHSSATGSQSSRCNGLHEESDCGESYCAKVAKLKESEDDSSDSPDSPSKFMYWTWTGLGYKRPGTKKNRNKEFYHGIQRGEEIIKVGDSALFISNGNARPFIGRVERFWEKKGKKIVNVRWFYHPEEVKTKKRLSAIKYPGALFESPHIDENDVQTIARKCEVLPIEEFQAEYGHRFTSKAGRSLSGQKKGGSPKDTYYLAGYYDPYTYNLKLNDLK